MSTVTEGIPDALAQELVVMRRDPSEFVFLRVSKCRLCRDKTGAIDIGHPLNPANAGSWCPVHGWLAFDSVKIRPKGEEYVPKRRKVAVSR